MTTLRSSYGRQEISRLFNSYVLLPGIQRKKTFVIRKRNKSMFYSSQIVKAKANLGEQRPLSEKLCKFAFCNDLIMSLLYLYRIIMSRSIN